MRKFLLVLAIGVSWSANAEVSGAKTDSSALSNSAKAYKSSILTTWLSFANFGEEKTNTHHIELHYRYQLTQKDVLGVKFATWKLFAPMGIQMWEPQFLNESEFYTGRLREIGIGFTYQRFLWKRLYASAEILPLVKTYLDTNNVKIDNGFKLYTTYHLGYHFSFLKNRLFVEPQIHGNYWPADTKGPKEFEEFDNRWSNYFLFEPNIYIGVSF